MGRSWILAPLLAALVGAPAGAAEGDLRDQVAGSLGELEARAASLFSRLAAAGAASALRPGLEDLEARSRRLIQRLEAAEGGALGRFGAGGAAALGSEAEPGLRFRVDAGQDRWSALKQALAGIFRAYVDGDAGGVLAHLASSVVPDSSIFYNALREDYEAETNIHVNVELLRYRLGREESCVDMRWNRSATRIVDGRVRLDDGTSTFCFLREGRMKLGRATGRLPFGLGDPDFQRQAAAGQLNPDPTNPGAGVLPVGVQTLEIDVDHQPGGRGNVAFVDLETGRVRKATAANTDDLEGEPGEDFYVGTDLQVATPPGICFHAVVDTGVIACDGGFGQDFSALRSLDLSKLARFTDDTQGFHFGVRTSEGNFAFVRVANFQTLSFVISRDPVIQPEGSLSCP